MPSGSWGSLAQCLYVDKNSEPCSKLVYSQPRWMSLWTARGLQEVSRKALTTSQGGLGGTNWKAEITLHSYPTSQGMTHHPSNHTSQKPSTSLQSWAPCLLFSMHLVPLHPHTPNEIYQLQSFPPCKQQSTLLLAGTSQEFFFFYVLQQEAVSTSV